VSLVGDYVIVIFIVVVVIANITSVYLSMYGLMERCVVADAPLYDS
jgi:hypothetical protein